MTDGEEAMTVSTDSSQASKEESERGEIPPRSPSLDRSWWYLDPGGAVGGFVFTILSMTPSLLPRPALLQGVVAGFAFAAGYLIGVLLLVLIRKMIWGRDDTPVVARPWWIAYGIAWVVALAGLATLILDWQNEVRSLVSLEPLNAIQFWPFAVSFLLVSVLLLVIGKSVMRMYHRLETRMRTLYATLVCVGIVLLVMSMLGSILFFSMERWFTSSNGEPIAELSPPDSDFRSAGPGSVIEWEDLGRHGSMFIGEGPTKADIEELTGEPAIEPIRVYAGKKSAETLEERADLVVSELERTGAFEREILVVGITTGSGWLEPQTVDSLEYLYGGDTAIAAMQYAFTPSWVSFLFDPDAPVDGATVLFEAVEERWLEIPEEERPRLFIYGLSLGAHGGQSVFIDLDDLRSRTDGALFVGPTNSSDMWQELQAARDPGSPESLPVLDEGREVRWMSTMADANNLDGPWEEPRVLFLQHPTDPVTWFSADLFFSKPDWLEDDQRSADISSSMRWMPVVTGIQVAVDLLGADRVPAQYGHNFGDVVVAGWVSVIGDPGLDRESLQAIQTEIETYASILPFEE
ncbi:alpha/beta hydrolase [Flaviflexus massiliensis]|uniref:alpha/beta hydrolase n=1 Tax=Flaviflexus massiliensis TaxID=1522309 RepID=UPI0006D5B256|nr:alpha/beta-hydrolase family protein [Flaviflexus massiliensis]